LATCAALPLHKGRRQNELRWERRAEKGLGSKTAVFG
jgi:hypothetical protein